MPRAEYRGVHADLPESSVSVCLIIPQKPWEAIAAELEVYRDAYRGAGHAGEIPPRFLGLVFCDEDGDRAERLARRYMGNYWQTVIAHYDLFGAHLSRTKGDQYYADKYEAGVDEMTELILSLQIYGTPDQCRSVFAISRSASARMASSAVQLRPDAARGSRAQPAALRARGTAYSPEGGVAVTRYTIISTDCHAGNPYDTGGYLDYVDPAGIAISCGSRWRRRRT